MPDFIVKEREDAIWIVETKGREDIEDQLKFKRLLQWCQDATKLSGKVTYRALFVDEEKFRDLKLTRFADLIATFG